MGLDLAEQVVHHLADYVRLPSVFEVFRQDGRVLLDAGGLVGHVLVLGGGDEGDLVEVVQSAAFCEFVEQALPRVFAVLEGEFENGVALLEGVDEPQPGLHQFGGGVEIPQMWRADRHKRMEMVPDALKMPQRASDDDPAHRMPDEADLEPPIQYLSHLGDLDGQSLAATVDALLSPADVRHADVHPHLVADLQALLQQDQVVSVGLEAVHQHHYVLDVTRHRLRRDDVAGFIDLLEDFYALSLLFKLMLAFDQKGLVPKLQLVLGFPAHHLGLLPVGLGVVAVLAEGPIVVLDSVAEDAGF